MNTKKCLIALMMSLSLTGCITFPTEESEKVQVVWDETDRIEGCELKGTVYGSEGSFYDYWLHSDRNMVWGTINQMSIKAADMGADTIYLYRPFGFLSSVTMMANAYNCSRKEVSK